MSLPPRARLVHLLSLEAGGERAEEIAPALRAAGYEVRLHGGPLPQLPDPERLRAELAILAAAARDALESGGLLLIADERAAMVVPELLRLLLDERGLRWDEAWDTALGSTVARLGCPKNEPARPFWTAEFLEAEQPRLLEILYEANRRHLDQVEARWRGDVERRRLLSLFREEPKKRLRTGLLAVLASRRADVATPWDGPIGAALSDLSVLRSRALHSRPTPVHARSWIVEGNPGLASLLTEALGGGWKNDPARLAALEVRAFDAGFRTAFAAARRSARERFSALLEARGYPALDPGALVDVRLCDETPQGRTVLNLLGVVREHLRLTAGGWTPPAPRVLVLAGPVEPRLAPLVTAVASAVENDLRARPWLRVVVLPDCDAATRRVAAAAADLSNQPGAAGSGAAGARALALAMGGALTLGTLNGSVRELLHSVGRENLFLFGLDPDETRAWREGRVYRPQDVYALDPLVRLAVDSLLSRRYVRDGSAFSWLKPSLLDPDDPWLVLADFGGYVHRQDDALAEFAHPTAFVEKQIVTIARARHFWVERLDLES